MSVHFDEEKLAEIRGAVARGYCSSENSHKIVDTCLLEAISRQVYDLFYNGVKVTGLKYQQSRLHEEDEPGQSLSDCLAHGLVKLKYEQHIDQNQHSDDMKVFHYTHAPLSQLHNVSTIDSIKKQMREIKDNSIGKITEEWRHPGYVPKLLEARKALEHLYSICGSVDKSIFTHCYGIPIEEEEKWLPMYYKIYPEKKPKSNFIIIDDPMTSVSQDQTNACIGIWEKTLRGRIQEIKEEPKQETWHDRESLL